MHLAARLAVSTAAGALIFALTMTAMSLAGIEWSRTTIGIVLILFIGGGSFLAFRDPTPFGKHIAVRADRIALGGVAASALLTLYGTITARESCGDLPFTWGPKAIRWFRAGG